MTKTEARETIKKLEKAGYEQVSILRDGNVWGVSWDGRPFGNPRNAWTVENGKLKEALAGEKPK